MEKIFKELTPPPHSSIIIKEEKAAQFAAPFHYHKGFELVYIVHGEGKFYGGNKILNFNRDELYLFGVDYPHLFVNDKAFITSGEIGHSIVVQFAEDYFRYNFALMPEFHAVKALLKTSLWGIKVNPNPLLKERFLSMTQKEGLPTIIALLQVLDFITHLPSSELKIISSEALKNISPNSSKDRRLDPVFQYILENFKSKLSSREAAALAFMNPSAFSRYFKRKTGNTFSQFVNHVRITHAISLLSEDSMSISEVCYQSGFENISYFNRQFKNLTGKTPKEYKKSK